MASHDSSWFETLFFSGSALQRVAAEAASRRVWSETRSRHRASARSGERIAELELDLRRVALVARTLADLCIAKGLFTQDEFTAQFAESDFADGALDAQLDPELVEPGEKRLADLHPLEERPRPQPVKRTVRKKRERY